MLGYTDRLTKSRDGIDGPWSTFNFAVGDPVQLFRCVPGVSQPVVFLPIDSQNCNSTSSGNCGGRATFHPNISKTWKLAGLFDDIGRSMQFLLPPGANTTAIWGLDTVLFGNNLIRDIGSARQYVAQVASAAFFIGVFGLALGTVSTGGSQSPNLLPALRNAMVVPSSSFSYTAGSTRSKVDELSWCDIY
jgi:hypothetical protein